MNQFISVILIFHGEHIFGQKKIVFYVFLNDRFNILACNCSPMYGVQSGCLVAMVMMLSMPHSHTMLYIGTAIFGMFMSSVFPTAISMTETYIHMSCQWLLDFTLISQGNPSGMLSLLQ